MKKIVCLVFTTIILLGACAQIPLIQNGDFSNGSTNWAFTGNWNYTNTYACPNNAQGYAYFGNANGTGINSGTGYLGQSFTIPANATSAIVSFAYSISTFETSTTTAFDSMIVFFWDNIHSLPRLVKYSNLDHTGSSTGCNPYFTFTHTLTQQELSQVAGLAVELHFGAFTDASNPTIFRVDDVSLTYTPCTLPAAPTGLSITSTSCNSIDLSWNAVSGSGVTYEVYKNNTSCGSAFGSSGLGPTAATSGTVNATPGNTYYLTVAATNSCGTSTNSNCVSVTTPSLPAQPGTIGGTASNICQGATPYYSISPVSGATSYTWTLPSGWSGSSTSTGISTIAGSSSGTITVTANSSCGSSAPQTLNVSVIPVPVTPIVTPAGPISICSPQTAALTISNPCLGCTYAWSDIGTGAITHNVSTNGSYYAYTYNSACTGNPLYTSTPSNTVSVVVNAAPLQPGAIMGSTSVCANSSNSYSIAAVAGATSYTWVLPNGWVGTSTTNSITASAGQSGSIAVTANNSCGSSSPQTLSITVNTSPAQPGSITGNTSVCANSTNTYNVAPVNGATSYTWTLPNGWGAANNTHSISVSAGASGTISVIANNVCGSSPAQTLGVTVSNTPAVAILPANPSFCPGKSVKLIASPGGTGYAWAGPNNFSAGTDSVSVSVSGNYTVSVTGAGGCAGTFTNSVLVIQDTLPSISITPSDLTFGLGHSDTLIASGASSYTWSDSEQTPFIIVSPTSTMTYSVTGTLNGCSASQSITIVLTGIETVQDLQNLIISPNPSSGSFTVSFTPDKAEHVKIRVCDLIGRIIMEEELTQTNGSYSKRILLGEGAKGIYMLQIIYGDNIISKKIEIQ